MSATATRTVKVLYTAESTVSGGRDGGHGRSSDGRLDVMLSVPEEMSGPGGSGTNPEQLFATAYAACFQSSLMFEARRQEIMADDSVITGRVGIGPAGEGRFGLTVELIVNLPSVVDRTQAEELVAAAHQRCPYSNAIRDNVDVTLTIS
jgi:osmotically inducible protein OsmC